MEVIIPKDAPSVRKSIYTIENFKGIDLSSSPVQVSETRSPDAPNMIGDLLGKPVKRNGYELVHNYGARINGRWQILEHDVIHAGTTLYIDEHPVYAGMANRKSTGQVIGDKLYIFDGEEPIVCDGEDAYELWYDAYVPTAYISKNPSGGGTAYEDINLLSPSWKDSFVVTAGDAAATEFQLSFGKLSKKSVKASVLNAQGEWEEKTEDTDFTVDRETGTVTFLVAPGATPVAGEDNVIITASRNWDGYYERIAKCTMTMAYNTSATRGRLFVAGDPEFPARDYWCYADAPEYFPDLNYSVLGEGDTKIIGYSILEGYLATHITPSYDGRCILLRDMELDEESRATFPVKTVMQGEEAIAPRSFVYMETEPLFITQRGVYAITPADIDGRMYTQNRSYYINEELTKYTNLKEAECAKYKHYYVIAIDGKLYLIDTAQKSFTKGEPLSNFQYECYEWTDIDARVLWEKDGVLYFGDCKGNVLRFTENTFFDYSEDGDKAIVAYWTLPDFSGNVFWHNKTIRTIAISCAPYPQNKVKLEKQVLGEWTTLKEWGSQITYFAWSALNWGDFVWSGNATYRTLTSKVKIKKFDKCAFRVGCSDLYKAFGLYRFSLEYTESGRYKK